MHKRNHPTPLQLPSKLTGWELSHSSPIIEGVWRKLADRRLTEHNPRTIDNMREAFAAALFATSAAITSEGACPRIISEVAERIHRGRVA